MLTLDERRHPGGDTHRDGESLSRELNEFLIELSVALHKYGMYPTGHPSLQPAAAAVAARATQLLVDRAQLAFGVARRQLIIEGVASSAGQPVLRRLAETLHGHHLGAVTILRGIAADEVGDALRALSREPELHGAIGSAPAEQRTWPHIRLHTLTFGGLAIVADAALTDQAQDDGAGTRGAELWIGLARAAVAADDESTPAETEPTAVARAIDEHPRADAYDQVVIGHLLQIARELRTSRGPASLALQQRTSRLIGALSPDTLKRLVDMSGDVAQRCQFVLDAMHGMAVETVIDIVKAAADASGQPISDGLVRMLSKLAAHAEFGNESARSTADAALRDQVGSLLEGWQLADPNPDSYAKALQRIATTTSSRDETATDDDLHHRPVPVRMVQISLEAGDTGPMVTRAIQRAVSLGQMAELVALGHSDTGDAARMLLTYLARAESLRTWFAASPIDFETLDRLLPYISLDGCRTLLDALAASDDRTTRRKLIDRLAAVTHDLEPALLARLDDERWFVQRNMLVLLERRRRLPATVSLARLAAHPDARVRYEAVRLQLRIPAERVAAVFAALESGHPGLMQAGLAAIQHECPVALVDIVAAIAFDRDSDETLRLMAAWALSKCSDPRALPPLLALADGGRTLFGRQRLAPRSPLMLAALEGLAIGWRSDPRAAALLRLAAASRDTLVRRAAEWGLA